MTEMNMSWAAGLFEGEGCITMKTKYAYTVLTLCSTDLDVLEDFLETVGEGAISGPRKKSNPEHRDAYLWNCAAYKPVCRILKAFSPYLGNRRYAAAVDCLARDIRGDFNIE